MRWLLTSPLLVPRLAKKLLEARRPAVRRAVVKPAPTKRVGRWSGTSVPSAVDHRDAVRRSEHETKAWRIRAARGCRPFDEHQRCGPVAPGRVASDPTTIAWPWFHHTTDRPGPPFEEPVRARARSLASRRPFVMRRSTVRADWEDSGVEVRGGSSRSSRSGSANTGAPNASRARMPVDSRRLVGSARRVSKRAAAPVTELGQICDQSTARPRSEGCHARRAGQFSAGRSLARPPHRRRIAVCPCRARRVHAEGGTTAPRRRAGRAVTRRTTAGLPQPSSEQNTVTVPRATRA